MTDQTAAPVVAAFPATGWRAAYRYTANGAQHIHHADVLAWLVRADGTVEPVTVDVIGAQKNPVTEPNFLQIVPPQDGTE